MILNARYYPVTFFLPCMAVQRSPTQGPTAMEYHPELVEGSQPPEVEILHCVPNDEITRRQLVTMIEPFLRDVQARRGIYDFQVICDETNNTPERIDRNELWCTILIKATRVAEFIVLQFVSLKTGASFEEAAQQVNPQVSG